eukprot:2139553-Amphidinium_carterae.2
MASFTFRRSTSEGMIAFVSRETKTVVHSDENVRRKLHNEKRASFLYVSNILWLHTAEGFGNIRDCLAAAYALVASLPIEWYSSCRRGVSCSYLGPMGFGVIGDVAWLGDERSFFRESA